MPSILVFESKDRTVPATTIAITTFRRPAFLLEALASVLAQRTRVAFEIVVVDNDPASDGLALVLERLPELKARNFRYYVNAENIGMFGNVNRSIDLARGEWLSILHDDDLLRDDFLDRMFAVIDRTPGVDGVVCQQKILDQRPPSNRPPAPPVRRMDRGYARELLGGGPSGWRTLARRAGGNLIFNYWKWGVEYQWMGKSSRRIRARTFFWGPVLGNGSGFLFRTRAAKDLGGFYAEEFPASDLYFYARFATRFHLRQHRDEAAFYRVAENESLKLDTALKAFVWIHRLQKELAGRQAPRWWLRFAPMMMAQWRNIYRDHWRIDIPKEQLEALLGMRLPEDKANTLLLVRVLFRGL